MAYIIYIYYGLADGIQIPNISQTQKVAAILLIMCLFVGLPVFTHAQDVIRATGGTDISIDSVATGGYVDISGPTIRETSTGQLQVGETISLTLPDGYEWNTGRSVMPGDVGEDDYLDATEDIIFIIESVGAQNTDLEVQFNSLTASEFTFTITGSSQTAGAGKGPARLTVEGLQITPANTDVPDEGTISNTGTTGPTDANYGNLSKKAGSIAEIRVETAADGSGQVLQEQELLAGNSLTVYAIARDLGGNFIENISLAEPADWELLNIQGDIIPSALEPSSALNSATFSSLSTGSANILAHYGNTSTIPSETITVLPRSADALQIRTQPSDTATAGVPFDPQPILALVDQFGNLVTTDNTTDVTASISNGSGTLLGTTTQTADQGSVSFSNLYTEVADTITLAFSGAGLDNILSNEIAVKPSTPIDLSFIQQPGNTARNTAIEPPVQMQLLDGYGNKVNAAGTTVIVSAVDTSGNNTDIFGSNSTLEVSTNQNGVATFDNLNISDQAPIAQYRLRATFNGISSTITSEPFEVLDPNNLAKFEITATDDADIQTQKAGQPFNIKVRAVDGYGNTYTDFNQTVTVTADANIQNGGGQTANFTDGVLASHSMTLSTSGETKIYVENININRNGESNPFTVTPAEVDFDSTEITADPQQIKANGSSTSEITVQLEDQFGNYLNTGGQTITIQTDAGTLSSNNGSGTTVEASDLNDGTYTATLTSSTAVETANLRALNSQGNLIASTQVTFTSGNLDSFVITIPRINGDPAIQTAGIPFDITVEAVDPYGNRVASYSGNLEFSTNATIGSGGSAAITDGLLQNHSIMLTKSDSAATIVVEDPNVYGVTGQSVPFIVEAAQPDPATSQVTADPTIIQNDGSSQSVITITLKDQYGNKVLTDYTADLSLSAEQTELNGAPTSGTPDATLGGLSFNASNSTYNATLTSTTTIENVAVSAEINGLLIPQQPTVRIVRPNTWEPGGSPNQRTDWNHAGNWSLGTVPTENDFVVIPGGLDNYPDLDLNISIGSLEIQQNGELVLFGGNSIEVAGGVQVDGTLDIEDNTNLFIDGSFTGSGTFASGESAEIEIGGDLSLENFLARTNGTVIRFNGSDLQTITSPNVLAQQLEILNDVTVTEGDLIDTSEMLITEGNTFELAQDAGVTLDNLQNISGSGKLILNNNTLVARGDMSLQQVDAAEGTVIFGIRTTESFADYPNLAQQQIAHLSEIKNAVVNNTEGVRTFEDIIISGDLTFENGELIISSGKSFIAPNQTYNNGSLTVRRTLSNKGWVMMGSPINAPISNLFEGLTTQGMANADYPNKQPNLLYYLESAECTNLDGDTVPCTDNQRWRTPADATDNIHSASADSLGRGYFFYIFGDVETDNNYNDQLPVTLSVTGQEYQHQNTTFDFSSVTYTASSDTADASVGWNLVANPWAATLDWDDAGWTRSNIDEVVYAWDPSINSYKTWNGIDGSLQDGLIKPFQAFWVKANGSAPSMTVNRSVKTTGGQFYGKSQKEPASIGFVLEADTLETSTYLTLTSDGSNAKDPRDGYRLLPFETNTYLELFTTLDDGRELAINNLARSFGQEIAIPLHVGGFKNGNPINGEYTLSWPVFGDVPGEWTMVLEDRKNGEKIDLRKNTFYSFNLSQSKTKTPIQNTVESFKLVNNPKSDVQARSQEKSSNEESRFVIHISPGADGSDVPNEYSLGKNYPNPFRDYTTIEYNTPVEGEVEIHIYDILGRKVKTILNEPRPANYHKIKWAPTQLASGIYIVVMRAGDKQFTKKITYIK